MTNAIARADSWKTLPFGELVPIDWRRSFTAAERVRLETGLVPEAMEDKWFIYWDAPSLFLHRSWTGLGVFRVDLAPVGDGAEVVAAWRMADPPAEDLAYEARLLDFLIANLLLREGKPFPKPEGLSEPMPGVYQHVVSGTGYPEAPPPARARRPWWRWWR
ncbi:hypothetical protein [Sphingomonas sp.]|uniref:hypothetical protein n=1 Tax=Sphingomonas sp. TaxID=28214 RepID=UPI001B101476|nr:hypothetical protein [Sphingomonas sp.]MBO9711936.1 hypothetical protein [Sphingomonas sp.]